MKYEPKRNYLYPVLRPYSDDYGDAKLQTMVAQPQTIGGEVIISMDFIVNEESVKNQIVAGNAICVAMLYCRSTLYRKMLTADRRSFRLRKPVEAQMLVNDVELHPSIVTLDGISHSTRTAHKEYGGVMAQIDRWKPLATDQTWRFQVNAESRNTQSIFRLSTDEELSDDEFDVKMDLTDRYLTITANKRTRERFQRIRGRLDITRSTIYMNALVEVMAYIKSNDVLEGDFRGDGWIQCIKDNLGKHGIDIGNSGEDGSHSIFRAAQLLLEKPFGELIDNHELAEDDYIDE